MVAPLPPLPYALDALVPVMSAAQVDAHANHHLPTYHQKYTALVTDLPISDKAIEWVLTNLDEVPAEKRVAISRMGGGVVNHINFFENLAPLNKTGEPSAALKQAIESQWGSMDKFMADFSAKIAAGWASSWTTLVEKDSKLELITLTGQEYPETFGYKTLCTIDAWEHAFYVDYQWKKAEYAEKVLTLINWNTVNKRYGK